RRSIDVMATDAIAISLGSSRGPVGRWCTGSASAHRRATQAAHSFSALIDTIIRSGGLFRCQPHERASFLHLLGDDVVRDLVVGGLGGDLLLHEFILPSIWPVLDNLLRVGLADPWQGLQLVFGRRVEV